MNLVNEIAQAMEMDEKSAFSDKLFNTIALAGSLLSAAFYVASLILFFINSTVGLYIFTILFYPMLILMVLSFFFSIPELLRNRYMSAIIAVIVATIMLVALIITLILQGVFLKQVYIIPFMFF